MSEPNMNVPVSSETHVESPPVAQPGSRHATRAAGYGVDPRRRSVPLATALSVVPGLGQIYIGYYKHGFIHAIVIASIIALLNMRLTDPAIALLALFMVFFWLYNIVDAGRRATFWNQVLEGSENVEIPSGGFSLPGPGGSLAGGVVLIVIGSILLANTAFGISLMWLEQWWPLAPIAGGVYLALKGRSGKD